MSSPLDPHLQVLAPELAVGTALDLGCGTGQNSIWLATQGWTVTGVDVAGNAIKKAQTGARQADVDVSFLVADLIEWEPAGGFDLVVSTYALPPKGPGRTHALAAAAKAVTPGGTILICEFDLSLESEGWMSAKDLTDVDEIIKHLGAFEVLRADVEVTRHAHGDHERQVPVAVVIASRPAEAG